MESTTLMIHRPHGVFEEAFMFDYLQQLMRDAPTEQARYSIVLCTTYTMVRRLSFHTGRSSPRYKPNFPTQSCVRQHPLSNRGRCSSRANSAALHEFQALQMHVRVKHWRTAFGPLPWLWDQPPHVLPAVHAPASRLAPSPAAQGSGACGPAGVISRHKPVSCSHRYRLCARAVSQAVASRTMESETPVSLFLASNNNFPLIN